MKLVSALLVVLGAALTVAGATAITWPAGVLAAGVLLLLAAIDLRGPES